MGIIIAIAAFILIAAWMDMKAYRARVEEEARLKEIDAQFEAIIKGNCMGGDDDV